MTQIEIQGSSWFASVYISEPNEIYHVTVKTVGDTKEDALKAAQCVQDIFTHGRTSYIRANPEAHSDTDFDTKITRHHGFGRFGFKLEAGEQQAVAPSELVIGFGDLQCKEAV